MVVFYDCFHYTGSGADYLPIPPSFIVLNDSYYYTCFNITIVDDLVIENTESFNVSITNYKLLPSSSAFDKSTAVILEPASMVVTIEDDDGKHEMIVIRILLFMDIDREGLSKATQIFGEAAHYAVGQFISILSPPPSALFSVTYTPTLT